MTTEQTIALNKLVHSAANVRHTGRTDGIGELAASIAAHGLRQNLNVLPREDGRSFEVVAGSRRLRAMKQLARAGKLAKDAPIPCFVLGESDDPVEISLAENAMRTAMHPDDQCEAFRALIETRNASVEDVAARFGVTPTVVRQRLKLAHVSPKLRALFQQGEMSLDHVMALAISDDHAAQEAAWESLPDWNREPAMLKRTLTREAVPLTDRLARFIGIDAYIAAGGTILRDLFAAEGAGYLPDSALVTRLAAAKLEEAASTVKAEGWRWVKPELTRDYGIHYTRLWPVAGDDDADEAQETFSAEDKARAGALVQIGTDGCLHIERGLIHPDDAKAEARRERQASGESRTPAGYSAALVAELTAHRTAALRVELARNPAIALAATVHALAAALLYGGMSCLDLRAGSLGLESHIASLEDSPAHRALAEEKESWTKRLPPDADELFSWCLAQPQQVLLDLLALLAGLTVDAVQTREGRDEHHDHADRLAETLSLDMQSWWTPSIEGFYQRLPKAALVRAVAEAEVALPGTDLGSLKKAEAARRAADMLAGSGWLPEPLCVQS